MADYKLSTFLKDHVPDFILDEHPDFVLFLKAYYEFLETKMPNQKNDLVTQLGKLRNLPNVDESINEFEDYFFEQFAAMFPRDTAIAKEEFIKNIFDFYKSKGSENSFRLLFRMLYGDEVELEYPKNNVLVASGSRWRQNVVLRADIDTDVLYDCDGTQKEFDLIQEASAQDIQVFLNGVLQTSGYIVKKESRKIVFDVAPVSGTVLDVQYVLFDIANLVSREIRGMFSGARAIIEKASVKRVGAARYFEILLDKETVSGEFRRGERINVAYYPNGDSRVINVRFLSLSEIESINIIDGGSGYSIGDQIIIRGNSATPAFAVVSSVTTGLIEELDVVDGGYGYLVNDDINAVGYIPEAFDAIAQTIDDTGEFSANTIVVNTDIISNFANVTINSLDYGFPSGNSNVNTSISSALTQNTFTGFGAVTSVLVSGTQISTTQTPSFNVTPQILFSTFNVRDLGIISHVKIVTPGQNYQIGDTITFTNVSEFSGQGAQAEVSEINGNGGITKIRMIDGGLGYQNSSLPTVSVNTSTGFGSVLQCGQIMGTGGEFVPRITDDAVGKILEVNLIDPGSGFETTPVIDLTQSGNGDALANVSMVDSFVELPGKWETFYGMLSNPSIKLQGIDYYIDFSYVVKSRTQFQRYRDVLKNILHPTGLISYSKFIIDDSVDLSVDSEIIDQSYLSSNWCYSESLGQYMDGLCFKPLYTYYNVEINVGNPSANTALATEDNQIIQFLTAIPNIDVPDAIFYNPPFTYYDIEIQLVGVGHDDAVLSDTETGNTIAFLAEV